MSLDAQDWVWENSRAKGTARLVLLAIADKASGTDCSAYAGTTMLMQRANAAKSSIVVAVDNLIESGELEIVEGRTGRRGERCYRLPKAVGHKRTTRPAGGPKSGPVQNPDRSENRTGGGPESGPGGSEIRTPTGPESGPQNTENAIERRGTQRESAGARTDSRRNAPSTAPEPLTQIDPHWQPSEKDLAAARSDLNRIGPAAADDATNKFIRHHTAKQTRAGDFGPLWVTWLTREHTPPPQTGVVVPLPGARTAHQPFQPPADRSVYQNGL